MPAADRLHLLGIRHHGPGSAASVVAALDAIDPAFVLIEGPPDANEILSLAALPGMVPPVAILVHAEDNPAESVFDPFAIFSPEWQALLWALRRGRPVRFADLPASNRLGLARQAARDEAAAPDPSVPPTVTDPDPGAARLVRPRDPMALLAAAAGESDGETWWNALVEQHEGSLEVFAAIEAAMNAAREAIEADDPTDPDERLVEDRREAAMRLAARDALKSCDGPVAFVCGAWHVPALRRDVPAQRDRDTLRGLPKAKVVATWIPWTDKRLAFASGYGAGVVSPGWYGHLWAMRDGAGRRDVAVVAASWQSRVAATLRGDGLSASTAAVIEATRLGLSLGALRGFTTPGLTEMQDASLAALCGGERVLLDVVAERLVIGAGVGATDDAVPLMPLQADLARWQKRLRLKPSAIAEEATLDLRSEAGLAKSVLFHRLTLIEVPWAKPLHAGGSRGTFRERWRLEWMPELSVKLVEALRFGATIEEAASNAALDAADNGTAISVVATVVETCLAASLPAAAERCIGRLQALAVDAADVTELMAAMPPLAHALRYGTARDLPREALSLLVSSLCGEVTAGLLYGCRNLDAAGTARARGALGAFDSAVAILDDERRRTDWLDALLRLASDDMAVAALRGFAARRCLDAGRFAEDDTGWFSRATSPAVPMQEAGDWLEGFLAVGAQLLLHDARFLRLVDAWMRALDDDGFTNLLPALRRAFSGLDASERRRLLGRVRHGGPPLAEIAGPDVDEAAFAAAEPLLRTILGFDPREDGDA